MEGTKLRVVSMDRALDGLVHLKFDHIKAGTDWLSVKTGGIALFYDVDRVVLRVIHFIGHVGSPFRALILNLERGLVDYLVSLIEFVLCFVHLTHGRDGVE